MFCSACGTLQADTAQSCPSCGRPTYGADFVPDGVKGWSWGAFFLNWIWALGNRTYIGLLALIPYVGVIVAIWLGIKGREMAWKNKHWDSLEHFNRVQRRWSAWGVALCVVPLVLGILAAVAIPAYQSYVDRAREAERQQTVEASGRQVSAIRVKAAVAQAS
jgi:hypothetical protein